MTTILHISSSARTEGSVSRQLTRRLIDRFPEGSTVIERDLAVGVPQLTDVHIAAGFTPAEDRTDEQNELLAVGAEFIDELRRADVVVIGAPIYNFGPPAELKAWVDHVSRSGVTFRVDDSGFHGLLGDRSTYVVYASGGVPAGSEADFVTPWIKTALGLLGIESVEVVAADALTVDDQALAVAEQKVDSLVLQ